MPNYDRRFPNLALVPEGSFGPVADFARLTLNSAQLRLAADYDPLQNFSLSTVEITIANGREAVQCVLRPGFETLGWAYSGGQL